MRGARGLRFRLHPGQPLDGEIFVNGLYERALLEFLRVRLPANAGTMLDVGANIGNHAIYLCDRFAHVHCFEPNPTAVERLEENIRLNRIENIEVHRIGLGSRDGSLPFATSTDDLGLARFVDDNAEASAQLPITSADRWAAQNGASDIDFIKIDVEGFELEVLTGLSGVIRTFSPLIAFESWGDADGVEQTIFRASSEYRLYEPVFGPSGSGIISKAFDLLINGRRTSLHPVRSLKGHSYPYILAIPLRMLGRFATEIELGKRGGRDRD